MKEKNILKLSSPLYCKLTEAYKIKNLRTRYDTCLEIAQNADKSDVDFLIFEIERNNSSIDLSIIPNKTIANFIKTLVNTINYKNSNRSNYILYFLKKNKKN